MTKQKPMNRLMAFVLAFILAIPMNYGVFADTGIGNGGLKTLETESNIVDVFVIEDGGENLGDGLIDPDGDLVDELIDPDGDLVDELIDPDKDLEEDEEDKEVCDEDCEEDCDIEHGGGFAGFAPAFMDFAPFSSATLAAWRYSNNADVTAALVGANDILSATEGIFTGSSSTLSVVGTTSVVLNGGSNGVNRAGGFDNKANTAHWLVVTSSVGYKDISVSGQIRSSGTGPRDFKLQYSTTGNSADWHDADSPAFTAGNNVALTDLTSAFSTTLPAGASGQTELYIRLLLTSNISARAGTGAYAADDAIQTGGSNTVNNIVITGTLAGTPGATPVDKPTASPAPRWVSVDSPANVVLESGTPGAEIWFTRDGVTTPAKDGANSQKYETPIQITTATTIKAIAVDPSDPAKDSAVETFVYGSVPNVVIHEFYPGGGNGGSTYNQRYVVLKNTTGTSVSVGDWWVRYIGATGAFGSGTSVNQYNYQIPAGREIPGDGYLRILLNPSPQANGLAALPPYFTDGALAVAVNWTPSASNGKIVLANSSAATNASTDTHVVDMLGYGTSNMYMGSAAAPAGSNTTSLRRVANGGSNNTDFAAGAIDLTYLESTVVVIDKPTAAPAAGTVLTGTSVSLNATAGDEIRYTIGDGTQGPPTSTTGFVYPANSISITLGNNVIKAIAVRGGQASELATFTYTVGTPVAANPTSDPVSGSTVAQGATIRLLSATADAIIRYTTDGSDPTNSLTAEEITAGNTFALDFKGADTVTVRAVATKSGFDNSAVVPFVFNRIVATPIAEAITKAAGTTVTVEGVLVYNIVTNAGANNGVYLQDGSGAGINVRPGTTANNTALLNPPLGIGKQVRVTGTISIFDGLVQLVPANVNTDVGVTNENPVMPSPIATTLDKVRAGDHKFVLVSLENIRINSIANVGGNVQGNHTVGPAGATVRLTGPALTGYAAGDHINIKRGVATVMSDVITIYVNNINDIERVTNVQGGSVAAIPPSASYIQSGVTTIRLEAETGASIYYAIGGVPTETPANLYTAPFVLNFSAADEVIQVNAIAVKDGVTSNTLGFIYHNRNVTIGKARSAPLGTSIVTEGIVTREIKSGASKTNNCTLYIQDDTAGIAVYRTGITLTSYEVGAKVRVTGTLSEFNGVRQIQPANLTTAVEVQPDPSAPRTPEIITIAQLMSGAYEGKLVKIEGVQLTEIAANSNHTIYDINRDISTVMRCTEDATLPEDDFTKDMFIDVIGIASNSDGTRQLTVSKFEDITPGVEPLPIVTQALASWNFRAGATSTTAALPASATGTNDAFKDSVFKHYDNLTSVSYTGSNGSVYTSGWNDADLTDKYWLIETESTDFSDLNIEFQSWGTTAGPRNFVLEINTGGGWVAVQNYTSTATASTNYSINLPSSANDRNNLQIRFRVVDTASISGGTVGSGGNSRMARIAITGVYSGPLVKLGAVTPSVPSNSIVADGTLVTFANETSKAHPAIIISYEYSTNSTNGTNGSWSPVPSNGLAVTGSEREVKNYYVRAVTDDLNEKGDAIGASSAIWLTYTIRPIDSFVSEVREMDIGTNNIKTRGKITSVSGSGAATVITLQDDTGAIAAELNASVNLGQYITVSSSTLERKNEALVLTGVTFAVANNADAYPDAFYIAATDFFNAPVVEMYESRFVKVSNLRFTGNNNFADIDGKPLIVEGNLGSLVNGRWYDVRGALVRSGSESVFRSAAGFIDAVSAVGTPNMEHDFFVAGWVVSGGGNPTSAVTSFAAVFGENAAGSAIEPQGGTTFNGGDTTAFINGGGHANGGYYRFKLDTRGFTNLRFSVPYRANNIGHEIVAQYSLDASHGSWRDIPGAAGATVNWTGNPLNAEGINNVSLPDVMDNKEAVYVRVYARLAGSEKGDGGNVTGTFGFNNVRLVGDEIPSDNLVNANPSAGKVPLGRQVVLSNPANAAMIYRVITDLEPDPGFSAYTGAVPLNRLPAVVEARSGSARIRRIEYEQSQVAAVLARPLSPQVPAGTQITLSTTTQGAAIMYNITERAGSGQQAVRTNQQYTGPITLHAGMFPVKIEAWGELTNWLRSASVEFSYEQRDSVGQMAAYYGQLHSHTKEYSDGRGDLADGLAHILSKKDPVSGQRENYIDFLAFTDHSDQFDGNQLGVGHWGPRNAQGEVDFNLLNIDSMTDINLMPEPAQSRWRKYQDDIRDFNAINTGILAIPGYEMTWSGGPGHINTFNTSGLVSRNISALNAKANDAGLRLYYEKLKDVPLSISQFNHPGPSFGTFGSFAYWDPQIGSLITMIEVGNGEGAIGTGGYFPSFEFYTQALDKGWQVAPTNNQDNHYAEWGTSNAARTVIYTDNLTEDGIYDGMRNRRMYATENKYLEVMYRLNGELMGSILAHDGPTVHIEAHIENKDPRGGGIGIVEVVTSGGRVVQAYDFGSNRTAVINESIPNEYAYYFLRVRQPDLARTVTAPVWVGDVARIGSSGMEKATPTAYLGEEVIINTTLFNLEPDMLVMQEIKYSVVIPGQEDAPIHLATQTVLPNVRPGVAEAVYQMRFRPAFTGNITVKAEITGTLRGVVYEFEDSVTFEVYSESPKIYLGIDGSHFNEYVSGHNNNQMMNIVTIAKRFGVEVEIFTTVQQLIDAANNIFEDEGKRFETIILTPPSRRNGSNGRVPVRNYSPAVLNALEGFAKEGGTLVITGMSNAYENYSELGNGVMPQDQHMSAQQNKILAQVGSTLRVADNRVNENDAEHQGWTNNSNPDTSKTNHALRLNDDRGSFDWRSPLLSGALKEQIFSQFGGSSVYVVEPADKNAWNAAPAQTIPTSVIPAIVTASTCVTVNGEFTSNLGSGNTNFRSDYTKINGRDMILASETVDHGGGISSLVVVAGGAFMSDFEIQAGNLDTAASQFINYNIVANILSTTREVVADIADIWSAPREGLRFTVEGIMMTDSMGKAGGTDKGFFDSVYIQDATGGINLFPVNGNIAMGQTVRASGFISSYQGERQLSVTRIAVIDDTISSTHPSVHYSVAQMNQETGHRGRFVETRGRIKSIDDGGGAGLVGQIIIEDGGFEFRVAINDYITQSRDAALKSRISVGSFISAEGFSSLELGAPRLRVRDRDEIVAIAAYPMLESVSPKGNNVEDNGDIILTFSEAMDTTAGTVRLNGNVLTGGRWSADGKVFTAAYSGLDFNADYTITIAGFKSAAGVAIADVTHEFSTKKTIPYLREVYPVGANVPITGSVSLTFSEVMDTTALGTVTLNGTALTGAGMWLNGLTYIIPHPTLQYDTRYTIGVAGFKSLAGIAMVDDSSNEFTTLVNPNSDEDSDDGGMGETSPPVDASPPIDASPPNNASPPTDNGLLSWVAAPLMSVNDGVAEGRAAIEDVLIFLEQLRTQPHNNTLVIKMELDKNENTEDISSYQIVIPQEVSGAILSANVKMQLETPVAIVTFDEKAVNTIKTASSECDMVLTINVVDPQLLLITDNDREKIGDRPIYEFSVIIGETKVDHFQGGKATITIPYALQPGENPNAIVVYYIDSDGKLKTMRGHYDELAGTVVCVTTHFSIYAVGYNPVTFTDVSAMSIYRNAVEFIAARGITNGVGDNMFGGERDITRGMFLVMLMRAYQVEPDAIWSDNFDDAYGVYSGYLAAAKRMGIVRGVGNNRFNTDVPLTRQEMFLMIYNLLNSISELPMMEPSAKKLVDFGDVGEISDWAKDGVQLLVESGAIVGDGRNIMPTRLSSREQMAQLLYNLLTKIS